MADKTITQARRRGKRLTVAYIKSILDYDPNTGLFLWKPRPNIPTFAHHAGKIAGHRNTFGHIQIRLRNRLYLAHRVAWFLMTGKWPRHMIDHKNGKPDDNRLENLRDATRSRNMANRTRNIKNLSGFKGVSKRRRGSYWSARIMVNHKEMWLGQFPTPEEAHAAYCKAAQFFHGEFARFE